MSETKIIEYIKEACDKGYEFDETELYYWLKSKGLSDTEVGGYMPRSIHSQLVRSGGMIVGTYIPDNDGDDDNDIIERDFWGQGWIYKNYHAYENNLNAVCYIPELSDCKYTHQDFLDMCDGQEVYAFELFDRVDWQSPETLLEEDYQHGEFDDCEVCEKMFASYDVDKCPHCHAPYDSTGNGY